MTVPERPTRVLVVDDEEQIRRALKSILSTRGYALEMAATAEEALLKAIDTPPDLVILDLALPDRSGIEVCRELRTWMTAPILILSVRANEADKSRRSTRAPTIISPSRSRPASFWPASALCCAGRRRSPRRRRW